VVGWPTARSGGQRCLRVVPIGEGGRYVMEHRGID
jgi:hypothetical protein